jgi:poly-beta-hydroxyalkanoate depolymerase
MILCAPLGDLAVTVCGAVVLIICAATLGDEDGGVAVPRTMGVLEGDEVDREKEATNSSCLSVTKRVIVHSEKSINVARRVITVSRKLRWEELGVSLPGSIKSSSMTAVPATKS